MTEQMYEQSVEWFIFIFHSNIYRNDSEKNGKISIENENVVKIEWKCLSENDSIHSLEWKRGWGALCMQQFVLFSSD